MCVKCEPAAECPFASGYREFRTVLLGWSVLNQHTAMVFITTPLLQRLHWLPVDRRITYKLCVLMFDVLHGIAPVYLSEMCSRCSDSRLRSSSQGNFVVTRTRTRFADSSFAVAGPAAWNSLPVSLKNIESHSAFCRKLKTHLFIAAFNCRCAKFYNFLLIRFYYVKRC